MKNKFCQKLLNLLFLVIFINSNSQTKNELKLYFDFNKSEISQNNKSKLDSLILFSTKKGFDIEINGYTDEHGSIINNLKFSEKRAKAVADYLLKKTSNVTYCGNGIYQDSEIDSIQRNVTLTLKKGQLGCGTRDKIELKEGSGISNVKILNTKEMIENRLFSVDSFGEIQKSIGIVSFKFNKEIIQKHNDLSEQLRTPGNIYFASFEVPVEFQENFDSKITMLYYEKNDSKWLAKDNDQRFEYRGSVEENIESYKNTNKSYKILTPWEGPLNLCRKINENEEVIYFSTFKDFNFVDIAIPDAKFATIIEDKHQKIYAFVLRKNKHNELLSCTAEFFENGKNKLFKTTLKNCKLTDYKNNRHYYLRKKDVYSIDKKVFNKGFFNWLINLF